VHCIIHPHFWGAEDDFFFKKKFIEGKKGESIPILTEMPSIQISEQRRKVEGER
jgi:hypothetical protein